MGQIADTRLRLNTIVGFYRELNSMKEQIELIYRMAYNNNIKFNNLLADMQVWSTADPESIEYELYLMASGILPAELLPSIIAMQTKTQELLATIEALDTESNNELLDINTDSI